MKKITIEPVTRVEGHGKVTIHLNDQGLVEQARLHIVEFRGFEKFVQGRPYWEVPVLVQRLCGICPVSHHLAGAKAVDDIVGTGPDGSNPIPKPAEKMRRLMHYGQIFQSHALHFYHLASPDLIFGLDGDPAQRNVIGVALANPELAKQAVMMRKFGQEIIKATAGKKVHGISAVPGGIHKNLSIEERDYFLDGKEISNIDQMIEWSLSGLEFYKGYHKKNKDFADSFAKFDSNHLGTVNQDGGLELYHGALRAVDAEGKRILNDINYHDYQNYFAEGVENWSYMKFPFLKEYGREKGWNRVGPLARLNIADYIPSPLAQKEFEEFKAYTNGKVNNMTFHYHWARLIEILHTAEIMKDLLNDSDLQSDNLVSTGEWTGEGVGVIEAPRGTLLHHYRADESGKISFCNLIVSTTHNNEAMNRAVTSAAKLLMNNQREITEGMMNGVEVAIRAYDPCLSCATHALGQMPLQVSLFDAEDVLINERFR